MEVFKKVPACFPSLLSPCAEIRRARKRIFQLDKPPRRRTGVTPSRSKEKSYFPSPAQSPLPPQQPPGVSCFSLPQLPPPPPTCTPQAQGDSGERGFNKDQGEPSKVEKFFSHGWEVGICDFSSSSVAVRLVQDCNREEAVVNEESLIFRLRNA